MKLKSGLYIVSTPIGNLEDITLRAINTLKQSTIILCEDTRVSQKLLTKYSITTRLLIYNDHSTSVDRNKIYELIMQGNIVSIISDAGTPLISDPGYKLVEYLKNNGCYIAALPGACAPIVALTLSALPSNQFYFGGFIPKTSEAKNKLFTELKSLQATLIFFDTANRLLDSLVVLEQAIGNRMVCVARELTKMYEEVKSGYCNELIEYYNQHQIKGEIVLLVSGCSEIINQESLTVELETIIMKYMKHGCSAKSASSIVYEQFKDKCSKQDIYRIANQLKSHLN